MHNAATLRCPSAACSPLARAVNAPLRAPFKDVDLNLKGSSATRDVTAHANPSGATSALRPVPRLIQFYNEVGKEEPHRHTGCAAAGAETGVNRVVGEWQLDSEAHKCLSSLSAQMLSSSLAWPSGQFTVRRATQAVPQARQGNPATKTESKPLAGPAPSLCQPEIQLMYCRLCERSYSSVCMWLQ